MTKAFLVTIIFTLLVIILSLQFCYKGIKSKNLDLFVEGLITLLISLCFGVFIFLC